MTEKECENHLVLEGEILESVRREGQCNYFRILCKPEYLVVSVSELSDLRLGERIILAGRFEVSQVIRPDELPEEDKHHT